MIGKLKEVIVLGKSLVPIFVGMLPKKKIYIVPNYVDDQYLMSDEEFEEKVPLLREKRVKHILYLSNFIRTKGYPEVLEMAKIEKKCVESGESRKFHFDFAGKFFKRRERVFFRYIKDNILEEYVTYHGVVGGEEKKIY